MSRAKQCDYCGSFFKYDSAKGVRNAITLARFNDDDNPVITEPWKDVCPNCMNEINACLIKLLQN